MSYQWKLGENVSDGIQRLIQQQIKYALKQLRDEDNNRDEAVHEARKSFKKIRAVLRLVRDEVGEDYYQQQNTFYRDLGRDLSPLRDAFVVVETMDALMDEVDDDLKAVATELRDRLHADFEEVKAKFWQSDEVVASVISQLEKAKKNLDDMPIKHDSFKAFKKGLRRVYKRGQKRMVIAYENIPSPDGFHDWRKRVKYLWYHMRILEPIHPAKITALVVQLDQLADLLGEAHDLAVLYERIEPFSDTDDGAGRLLMAYLDQKRGDLEASARPFGDILYEMDAKAFVKDIKQSWKNPEPIIA